MALLSFMARLGLDATGFEKNMAKADSQVNKFAGQTLGALKTSLASAFAMAVIIEKFKSAINYAGELTDQMKRLGVSSEFLQGWSHGLELAGGKAEDLTAFLEKLAVSREKALGGDSGSLNSFAGLGVSLKDINDTDLEGLARKIAKIFTSGNPQDFIRSLREVGGKSAGALIPAFVENIEDAEREAHKLGLVMDKETRVALDALGDSFVTAGKKSKVFFGSMAKNALDAESRMISLTKAVVDFSKTLIAEGKDDPNNWSKRRPISEVAHDAMTSRYLRERESGTGLIGSGALALGDFISAHFQDGGSGPGDQFANAMKAGKNAYALQEAMAKAQRDAALKADGVTPPGSPPTAITALARAIEASQFQSSADKTVAGLGGYYLGGDSTARNDLARQALDLAKRTADSVRKIEENTGSIRVVVEDK